MLSVFENWKQVSETGIRHVLYFHFHFLTPALLIFPFMIWYQYCMIQRSPEKPCLNDVTEVGTWRKTVLTVAIFLVVLTLLPVWDELAEELGIGLVTTFWCILVGVGRGNQNFFLTVLLKIDRLLDGDIIIGYIINLYSFTIFHIFPFTIYVSVVYLS